MAQGTDVVAAEMRTTALEVDRLDSETQAALKKLQGEAQALRGNWRSDRSGRSFDQTMEQWNRDAADIQNTMREIAKLMRTTADRYDRTEDANVQSMHVTPDGGRNYDLD
jgi:ESAT-6 family protein